MQGRRRRRPYSPRWTGTAPERRRRAAVVSGHDVERFGTDEWEWS